MCIYRIWNTTAAVAISVNAKILAALTLSCVVAKYSSPPITRDVTSSTIRTVPVLTCLSAVFIPIVSATTNAVIIANRFQSSRLILGKPSINWMRSPGTSMARTKHVETNKPLSMNKTVNAPTLLLTNVSSNAVASHSARAATIMRIVTFGTVSTNLSNMSY